MTQINIPIPKIRRLTTTLALLFVVMLSLLITGTKAQTTQTFSTSGTFTVPAGVTSITVSAWGGGGAGGGVNGNGSGRAGGGGEGGSFVRGTITVVPSATYTVVVGAGGTGAVAANGSAGTASSFSASGGGATLFNAIGGTFGAVGSNFGAGGSSTNTGNIVSGTTTSNFYGGNGGNATNASTASSGGGGGSAGAGGNGGNGGSPLTGGTAGSGSGSPSDPGIVGATGRGATNDGDGIDGGAPGAGGSGARNANNNTDYQGGDGGAGQVKVTWTCSTYSLTATSNSGACSSSGTSTITLTGSAAGLPVGTYTVTYNRGTPSATGLQAAMTVSTAGSGTFTASGLTTAGSSLITITNLTSGTTGGTCSSNISSNNTTTVTVVAGPTVTFTSQPGASACVSTDVTYTTQSGQSNYVWTVPGVLNTDYSITSGGIGTSSNTVTLKWLTTGSKTVTINYTNAGGCAAASPTSSTATTVNARPTVTFTVQPGANACITNDVTYTTQSGQSAYVWTLPGVLNTDYSITSGGIGSTNNTVTLKWLTTGSKTVTINYNNASGCTATAATSSTATTINTLPTVTFTAQPGASVCSNTDVTYTTQSGQSNYVWTVPGVLNTDYSITSGGIGTSSNTVTLKWLTAGSKTVTINYNNASGCDANTPTSSTPTVVSARPTVTFTAQPGANACINNDVTYTTQSGQSAYVWNVPGVLNTDYSITSGGIGSTNNTVTLKWLTTGGKTVTINYTNASGCTAVSATSSTATSVNTLPTVTFTVQPGASACSGTDVTYTTQSGQSNYVWTVPGVLNTDYTITSGGIGSTNSTVTLKWLSAGSKTVSINYNNAAGCTAAAATSSNPTTVTLAATAVAGTAISTCGYLTAVNITAGSSSANNNGVTWTCNGTGTFANANSLTTCTYTPSAADIAAGSRTLTLTATGNSPCGNVTSTKTITFVALPSAVSVTPSTATVCSSATSIALTGAATTTAIVTVNSDNFNVTPTYTGSGSTTGNRSQIFSQETSGTTVNSVGTFTSPNGGGMMVALAAASGVLGTSTSSANTLLTSPAINTNDFTTLSLTYNHTYKQGNSGSPSGKVEVSTNGTTWTTLKTFTTNQGGATSFVADNITLSNTYLNQSNLQIRFNFVSSNSSSFSANSSWWAIDDVLLNGVPVALYSWSSNTGSGVDGLPGGAGTPSIANKNITVAPTATTTYTVTATDQVTGCTATSTSTVTVNPVPTASAGPNQTICAGSTATMTGAFGGDASSATWSTSGTGSFDNNNTNAIYTPSAGDISAGSVTLTYTTNDPAGPCGAVNANMTLTINPVAVANAGADFTVCESATALMSGVVSGAASSGTWTTAGDGTFDNASLLNAVYTPGSNDLTNGSVVLTLTTNDPAGPCDAVIDNVVLSFEALPTANAGSDVTVCNGSSVSLAGTVGGSAAGGTWATSGDGSFNNANNLGAVYTPGSNDLINGIVTLTLTTSGSSYCSNVNDAMVVTFNSPATANAGADMEICAPSVVLLNGAYGGAASSASWTSNGDGSFNNANLLNAIYTPGSNDVSNGSVILTLTTNDPAGPCNAVSDNLTVIIRSTLPMQPASITGAPTSVCPPLTGVVLNTNNDPNATDYTWTTGPGTTGIAFAPPSSSNTQIINITPTTNSTYSIRVVANNACGSSLYRSVGIRRSVSTPVSVTGNTVACANSAYTYSTAAVVGAETYTWTGPTGSQVNGGSSSVTTASNSVDILMPNGFTSGSVSVTANVGCFTSSAKTLNISNTTAVLSTISGPAIVCPGGTQTFTVPAVAGASNYVWTLPNNSTGSSSTNSINITFNTGFVSSNICVKSNSVCGVQSAPRCKSVSLGVPAQPSVVSGNTNGLCGQNTSFSTPPVSGVTYTWTPPSGYSNLVGQGTNSISVTMPSNFLNSTLCVTATNACGNSTPRCIAVKGAPLTPAAITATPGSWCAPTEAISFTSNTSALTGVYNLTWTWVPANAATYVLGQGTNNLVLDWDIPGNATLYLTASNACGNTTRTLALNVASCRLAGSGTAAQELISSEKITVYPNPANNIINIDYDLSTSGNTVVSVIDLSGKQVLNKVMNAAQGFSNNKIDVSRLAKGMYLLKVETPDGNVQSRIVIE